VGAELLRPQALTALIDRLVHHSEIINIDDKSYRAREAEEAKPARRNPKS
jgi:DNA replication protein DnaC